MKVAALIAAGVLVTSSAHAGPPAPNTVFAEGLGAGVLYSVNYERRVLDWLGLRAGLAYWNSAAESDGKRAGYATHPITVSVMPLRYRKLRLETGLGGTFAWSSLNKTTGGIRPYLTGFIGLRLQPHGAGFQFRVGAMVLAGSLNRPSDHTDTEKFRFVPWGYMSLGASF